MLNDLSSTLALLETRRSGKPREMVGPGPSDAELERILAIASRTPDHGKLFPWRFVTVSHDQRDDLAVLLHQALNEHDPCATAAHHEKEDEFAQQAPTLIVLVAAPIEGHKIPVWEQQLSCGAACFNLELAAIASGFAVGWVTGWAAYSPIVLAAFGAPHERIAGFLFLGSQSGEMEERGRPEYEAVASEWPG